MFYTCIIELFHRKKEICGFASLTQKLKEKKKTQCVDLLIHALQCLNPFYKPSTRNKKKRNIKIKFYN